MRRQILFDDVFTQDWETFFKKLETVLSMKYFAPPQNCSFIWRQPLLVRDCKFRPMLGVHGGWAARIFIHVTPTVTQDTAFKINYRDMWFSPPVVKHLVENLLLSVLTTCTSVATRTRTSLCYSWKTNTSSTYSGIYKYWFVMSDVICEKI